MSESGALHQIREPRCFWAAVLVASALVWSSIVADDPMYASTLATAVVCLPALRHLVRTFPSTLDQLWMTGVLGRLREPAREPLREGSRKDTGEVAENDGTSRLGSLPREYSHLLTARLRQWRWLAVPVALVLSSWRIIHALGSDDHIQRAAPFKELFGSGVASYLSYSAGLLAELFVAAVVGMMFVRFLVIGWSLSELPCRFALHPLFHHPDRCGGLKSLGSLSGLSALIVSVPGIVLAVWILAIERSSTLLEKNPIYAEYSVRMTGLLFVLVILAGVAFITPLWRIHQVMVGKAPSAKVERERTGRRISEATSRLLGETESVDPDRIKQGLSDLGVLRDLYKNTQRIPVWPFDLRILARTFGPLLLPLLGLLGQSTAVAVLREILTSFLVR